MLIELLRKHTEWYFLNRKYIQKAVDDEREQRTAKKGHTVGGGHAFISNPTETSALKNIEPIKMISWGQGPYQTIVINPEAWLEVIAETYKVHEKQAAGDAMFQRYEYNKSPGVIAGLKGMNRDTYYELRNEFLNDAVILALEKKLLRIKMYPTNYLF
jgi:hypothetical protein